MLLSQDKEYKDIPMENYHNIYEASIISMIVLSYAYQQPFFNWNFIKFQSIYVPSGIPIFT